jgi:hypothetical protein
MDLYVGLPSLRGRIERYRFGLLELPVTASLAKNKTLRAFREAKPSLVFSLRLPPEVAEGAGDAQKLLARAVAAADVLGARFVVIATGPRFRPTTANKKRLIELADAVRGEGRRVSWEPRGMWADDELGEWSRAADVLLVRDLARESVGEGDIVYTRLLPFGVGTRVTQHALEKLALALDGKQAAYVVIGGEGAQNAQSRLRQMLAWGGSAGESEDDEPYDDEDGDEPSLTADQDEGEEDEAEEGDDE